ncbi:hypothetical protein M976_02855 [Buttiauxella ferragutiae ATCC 51602]|uniref:Lipoprotein n=1 Tax=Buttiauxella ferragutiae ATCC 51602 TaxID=1354252 RepID=A0ABX2W744_9ENTR|nr:hypothetical protein M976_02855 [Buttiauxella ferragutiae ATCC 51602]
MISAGVLFTLAVAACSPSDINCEDGVLTVFTSEKACEEVIFEERLFNAQCIPINGVARQQ